MIMKCQFSASDREKQVGIATIAIEFAEKIVLQTFFGFFGKTAEYSAAFKI